MRQLTKPIWSEGMYLGPHHFQAQNRYFEDSLNFVTSSLWRDAFGFAALQVDNDALRNGTISLAHARGLFEDGLSFDLPGADAAPPSRDFSTLFSPVADHLVLYLAAPINLREGQNASLDSTADSVRYLAVEQIVPDQNTGRDEKPIRIGRKNLRFLVDAELTDQFVSLPLVRVTRDGSGHFAADPAFVPPCLSLSASPALISMLHRLIDILDEKSAVFSHEQHERNGVFQAGMSARHVAHYWFLHAVNSNVSVLRHFLLSHHVHPQELFREMSRLAGALCTFGLEVHPRSLPTYDHRDLGTSFAALDEHNSPPSRNRDALQGHQDSIASRREFLVQRRNQRRALHWPRALDSGNPLPHWRSRPHREGTETREDMFRQVCAGTHQALLTWPCAEPSGRRPSSDCCEG
ncbi:MAG: type VI secretion system baseplate subunit TssK [Terracidiphilus sp.]|nr:type VI secretion system baseplate subunit TssK [Terracidiphilus sp.]